MDYLDSEDTQIYLGSCLYSASTAAHEFGEIAKFLKNSPSEIVIIDLNGDWLHTASNTFYIALDTLLNNRFFITFFIS